MILYQSVLPKCATSFRAKNSVLRPKMALKAKINWYYVVGDQKKWKIVVAHFDIFGIRSFTKVCYQNVLPVLGQTNSVLRPQMALKDKINWYYVVGDQKKWKIVVAHVDIFGIS